MRCGSGCLTDLAWDTVDDLSIAWHIEQMGWVEQIRIDARVSVGNLKECAVEPVAPAVWQ